MEAEKKVALTTNLGRKIRSLSLDKATLRRLLDLLQERSFAAGDIEVANFQQGQQTPEVFDQNKKTLKECFRLYITLTGVDGVNLNGSIEAIFDSPNFPESVASVFFDSATPLKIVHKYTPRNHLVLNLDFTRPEVLNFTLLPSQETPNGSNFSVSGNDSTWVHGVYHEFDNFVKEHPSIFGWLHRHSIYDLFVWLLGLPLGLWCCFRASSFLDQIASSPFLKSAAYIYIFFVTLFGLRILFHYARWIWPLVEFRGEGNKAVKHRAIWSAITLGLLVSFIYDLLKVFVLK
jgi:hypothetical protein